MRSIAEDLDYTASFMEKRALPWGVIAKGLAKAFPTFIRAGKATPGVLGAAAKGLGRNAWPAAKTIMGIGGTALGGYFGYNAIKDENYKANAQKRDDLAQRKYFKTEQQRIPGFQRVTEDPNRLKKYQRSLFN